MKYYFCAFKNYFKSDGRATRKEYWCFILFHYVVMLTLAFLDGFFGFYSAESPLNCGYLTLVYILASACPSICLQIRRLHDVGKSGGWWWLKGAPILSWYIIYLNCKASDPKINIYGAPVNDKLAVEGNCCEEMEKVPVMDTEGPLREQSCKARSVQFSLSPEGETPRAYGNYNVYWSDIALDSFSPSQEQQEVSVSGDQEQPAQITTHVVKRRKRYCSRCGNAIDPGTKKCTGCGKQYFKGVRFTKLSITITAFVLVIATLSSFCILQYANIEALNDKVSTLESEASNKQATIYSLTGRVNNLQNQVQENKELADFIDDYVVFIEDDGTDLYHKYKCYKFKGESFWVLNINAAKEDGYKACPNCH